MTNIKVGEKAPEFKLSNSKNESVSLDDSKGKKVILSFYPVAFTPVWKSQIGSLEANFKRIQSSNTIAIGISIDSIYANDAWAEKIGIKNTILLSDFWPHGQVASQYGVFCINDGMCDRANIVLDEDHNIIFHKVYSRDELPDMNEIYDLIK